MAMAIMAITATEPESSMMLWSYGGVPGSRWRSPLIYIKKEGAIMIGVVYV
jgi:hypothetical protein